MQLYNTHSKITKKKHNIKAIIKTKKMDTKTEREKDIFLEKCANLWLVNHLGPTKQNSQFIVSCVIDKILQMGKFKKPDEIMFDV